MLAENDKWIWRRCRRKIPSPEILLPELEKLFDTFREVQDAVTGVPLFNAAVEKAITNALQHVKSGCLSDIPGVQLYFPIGRDKNWLMKYRCIRGTNSNEGSVHQKIIVKFGAFNAGPILSYYMLLDFACRTNMKADTRNLGLQDYGVNDPWRIDKLQNLSVNLYDEPFSADWVESWRVKMDRMPFIMGPIVESGLEPFDENVDMNDSKKFMAMWPVAIPLKFQPIRFEPDTTTTTKTQNNPGVQVQVLIL